ncbi:MAG TPA: hypothetical protein VIY28_01545 [Pseudonocardiaceae bacterium]
MWAVGSSILEDGKVEPAQTCGVGECVDFDDLPPPDGKAHDRDRPSPRSNDDSCGSVDEGRRLLSGPIPVRILRAAQFHEFVAQLVEWGRQGDVSYVSKMRTQLVAARTIAQALADLATDREGASAPGSAGTPALEIAGPREENLVDMAKLLTVRRGDPVRIEGVSNPADPDSDLFETGALLPGRDAMLAGPTFEEWLDATP